MENLQAINQEGKAVKDDEQPKYNISHLVSANKLKTYIRIEILDKDAEVDCNEIVDYLMKQNIIYGIKEEEIINYCKEKEYSKELIAAVGKSPVRGKDAELVYDFDISKETKLLEKEDGTIDFKDLNKIINVKKDTVLCHIIPASDGEDGIDVYGHTVPFIEGKTVTFNNGNNTYISKDGLRLYASTDGCVELRKQCVYVESVYKVNHVDNNTGNINFLGNVIINGDVKAGFTVDAKGDINIKGIVEGAYIRADGNIVISKGMNGMGKGKICAGGNITSKYIENATVTSERSVYSETLINSNVSAGDSIILKGYTAAIIGGVVQANNVISAKTIGSKTNIETNIIIDLTKYQEEQRLLLAKENSNQKLEKKLLNKEKELKLLDQKHELIMKMSMDDNNKNSIIKQLTLMKIKLNNEIYEIKKALSDFIPTENIVEHKVLCKGTMYSNTKIIIGWLRYNIRRDISHCKLYNDGNDILVVPLNPGDIEQP